MEFTLIQAAQQETPFILPGGEDVFILFSVPSSSDGSGWKAAGSTLTRHGFPAGVVKGNLTLCLGGWGNLD